MKHSGIAGSQQVSSHAGIINFKLKLNLQPLLKLILGTFIPHKMRIFRRACPKEACSWNHVKSQKLSFLVASSCVYAENAKRKFHDVNAKKGRYFGMEHQFAICMIQCEITTVTMTMTVTVKLTVRHSQLGKLTVTITFHWLCLKGIFWSS